MKLPLEYPTITTVRYYVKVLCELLFVIISFTENPSIILNFKKKKKQKYMEFKVEPRWGKIIFPSYKDRISSWCWNVAGEKEEENW